MNVRIELELVLNRTETCLDNTTTSKLIELNYRQQKIDFHVGQGQ